MADISVTVYRPVALGQKFLGAPLWPAGTAFIACGLVMMGFFAAGSNVLFGLLAMLIYPPLHGFIMYLGFKEPHLNTLMAAYNLTFIAPRTIEAAGKSKRIFHPA